MVDVIAQIEKLMCVALRDPYGHEGRTAAMTVVQMIHSHKVMLTEVTTGTWTSIPAGHA